MAKKSIHKNGQITVFIIIAILIVAVILFLVFTKTNILNSPEEKISPQVMDVYSFVKECIQENAQKAVFEVSFNGGYFEIPQDSTEQGYPYYFDSGINLIPTKERIENELANYLRTSIALNCVDFTRFSYSNVTLNGLSVSSNILDDVVIFNITYPLTISRDGKNYNFKSFKDIEIPVRLGTVYNAADDYTKEQVLYPDGICISCIFDVNQKYGLKISTYDYNNESVIFSISDEKSKLNNQSLLFNFANRYDKTTGKDIAVVNNK